jgi:nucleotide-binding universal stress UspA family protein
VDWATAEAAPRGCPLRVVHAFRPPFPADAYGFASPIDSFVTAHTAAQLILGDAVTRARSVAPGIEVSTRLARGTAARALLGEARDARLLVLGSRGRSGLGAVLSGSVAGPVSRRSPCPIVVIRPFANRPADRVSLRSAPRVVVGIDPAASRSAATGFAFHAASQRGIPLTVLSAWTPDTAADIAPIPGPPPRAEAAAGRAGRETLARWRGEFPTVPVITTLVCADPASALIAESSGAALLVVGSSGRGHLRGLLCGSVSRTVLCDAGCPVAIVGRDRTTAGRTTAGRMTAGRMTAALTRAERPAIGVNRPPATSGVLDPSCLPVAGLPRRPRRPRVIVAVTAVEPERQT